MIDAPNHISGSYHATGTGVDAPAFPALATYGTRLRRIPFFNLDGPGRLVVEQGDQLPVASLADRLCLHSAEALCRPVESASDIALRIRKSVGNLAGGFVAGIPDAAFGFCQHPPLLALQTLPATGTFDLARLDLHELCQHLISALHDALDLTTGDEYGSIAVRCGNQSVHSEVNAKRRACIGWLVGYFTGDKNTQ